MSHSAPPIEGPPDSGQVSRRTVVKTGAAAGAALVWAVPAMQIIGMASADAASGGTPPPPPPPSGSLPSHGFALIDCGDGVFAVKIDSGDTSTLSGLGNQDKDFLATKGLTIPDDYRNATSADLAHLTDFGVTAYGGQVAMYITLPSTCHYDDGYTYVFDGSFSGGGENCGDGDKFTKAIRDGQTVYFATICNEPSTGES